MSKYKVSEYNEEEEEQITVSDKIDEWFCDLSYHKKLDIYYDNTQSREDEELNAGDRKAHEKMVEGDIGDDEYNERRGK